MQRPILRIVVAALATATVSVAAAPPRVLYERAQEREQAVRTRLDAPRPSGSVLAEARRVVTAYERIALAHPGSGYSDNALWQAGRLASDVWATAGYDNDRTTALRLYRALVKNYPSSSLLARARAEISRLDAAPRRADASADAPVPPAGVTTTRRGSAPAARATSGDADERIIPVPDATRVVVRDLPPPPPAPPAPKADTGGEATVRAISRTLLGTVERVTIELDRELPFHDERIADPDRVFVDVRNVRVAREARRTQKFSEGSVRQIRVGEPAGDTTRIVLDLDQSASHSVFTLYSPFRIVIDCERRSPDTPRLAAKTIGPTAIRPPAAVKGRDVARLLPLPAPSRTPAVQPASAPVIPESGSVPAALPDAVGDTLAAAALPAQSAPVPVAAAPALPSAPATNLQGRFSLSRQLGLGIARVVIDAGHGGHDPGAQVKGLNEADLVLDVALRLEQLLLKQPGVEVVLTRRTDVFIPLEERTAIANREGADLFLSIHANASRNLRARGIETYFLNFASNPDAEAVAARENAASGRTMHSLPDIVKAITLNNKLDESRDFATMVQRSMIQRLRGSNKGLRDLGVKQAPFVVLIGAAMPSVLAEISFVTHPQEGKLLKSTAYRQKIAEALFQGVAQYQRSLKSVQTVANQ